MLNQVTSGPVARPGRDLAFILNLSGWSDFSVAIAAINWFITARLERDFGGFSALGAGRREHLARGGSVAAVAIAF